jgi:hypothetical protein
MKTAMRLTPALCRHWRDESMQLARYYRRIKCASLCARCTAIARHWNRELVALKGGVR